MFRKNAASISASMLLLVALLALAFLLRIWGIWNADSSDEYNEVFEALRVASGQLNFERWIKRFYLYILAVEYGIYYAIGWIFNIFASPADFAVKILRDPFPLFMLGRITSAILGTGSVLLTYFIGKLLYNRTVGLIAALFLCFNVVNIELSHYARVDASLCFVVLAAFYFIARIVTEENRLLTSYIFAGIFSGIAFQNKMQAVILIFPFLYAHATGLTWKNIRQLVFSRLLIFFGLAYLTGMIIGNPAIVAAPISFIKGLTSWGSAAYTTPINETISSQIGYIAYLHYFYKELGPLLTLLAVAALGQAIFRFSTRSLLLLSFIVPFYGLMGATKYMISYSYMIPLMPFLYLLMAKTLADGFNYLSDRSEPATSKALAAATLVLLMVHPVLQTARFEFSMTGKNNRVLAKEWIEENIPYGSKILMDSGKTINSFAPLIAENEKSIQRTLNRKQYEIATNSLNDPTRMVDSSTLKYFSMLLKTVPRESYDITSTQFGLSVESIDYYIANNYEYFIISEGLKKNRTSQSFAERHPDVARFYRNLDHDSRVELIKEIKPGPGNLGQDFYIYKLRNHM
ncbi:MAG: glycosyltransferase family 39 protein [Desulfobulbaceae bacterium]|nr:glycosyltransferase family 39 protein [Desulfobulbaceae bacterium]